MQLRRNKGSGKAEDSLVEEKKQGPMLSEIKTCDRPHLYLPNLSACPLASEIRFLIHSIEPIISALGHMSNKVRKLLQIRSSKHSCDTSNVLSIELALQCQAWEAKATPCGNARPHTEDSPGVSTLRDKDKGQRSFFEWALEENMLQENESKNFMLGRRNNTVHQIQQTAPCWGGNGASNDRDTGQHNPTSFLREQVNNLHHSLQL